MSFDDIMNKFIPQCSEKSIKIIKEIKELKNFTNL
jgi:predicted transcriptional regulator